MQVQSLAKLAWNTVISATALLNEGIILDKTKLYCAVEEFSFA